MYVKMKPVCDCGYIFDELIIDLTWLDWPISHPRQEPKHNVLEPRLCPACGEIIEGALYQFPEDGRIYYDQKYYDQFYDKCPEEE